MPDHSLTWVHLGSCVDLDAPVVVVVPVAVVGLDKVAVVVAVVAPELVVKDPADVEGVDAVEQTVVIAFDTVALDHL